MRLFVKTLQSVLMVLSIMMMIFLILDGFNPTMNFLRNGLTKGLLWIFSLLALLDHTSTAMGRLRQAASELSVTRGCPFSSDWKMTPSGNR